MTANWAIATLTRKPTHTLHHWQVFEINRTGVLFLPVPGPRFRVLIGMLDRTSDVTLSEEIVAFDPAAGLCLCGSGKIYLLGPDAGFTSEIRRWYRQRMVLAVANPVDVTQDVLDSLGRPAVAKAPGGSRGVQSA